MTFHGFNSMLELTAKVNIDELRKDERHGTSRRPGYLFVHDRYDGFMKEVGQRDLLVTVMRHDVTWRQTRDHNLHTKIRTK